MPMQFLAESISFSVHQGLVKAAVDSGAGQVEVLFTFASFAAAVRAATQLADDVDTDHRGRIAPACQMCDRRSRCPTGEH